jgi:hypothetical protein
MPSTNYNESALDAAAGEMQAAADAAYRAQGQRAQCRVYGESLDEYQRRLLRPLQHHSDTWKDKDLAKVDASILPIVAPQIFAAAAAFGRRTGAGTGPLREVVEPDQSGRNIHRFYGDPEYCWAPSKQPVRGVTAVGGR